MSWFSFWRRRRRRGDERIHRAEPPATDVALTDDDVEASEELTEVALDPFQMMLVTHRRALSQGNRRKADELLAGLRAFTQRPGFSTSERAQFTLALHYARNAAEARHDQRAVESLTAEMIQWLRSEDPRTQAENLLAEGQRAFEQGEVEAALGSYERIIERYSGSREPELRGLVALALFLRTTTRPPDVDAELGAYAYILREFDTGETASLRHCTALTLFNQALRLRESGLLEASFQTYSQLIDRFRTSADPNIQLQVAKSLINRGTIFSGLGRASEELNDYAEVIERFQTSPYPELQRQVAFGLCNKASVLDRNGRLAEADEARAQLIARFAHDRDPQIGRAVATALESRVTNARHPPKTLD